MHATARDWNRVSGPFPLQHRPQIESSKYDRQADMSNEGFDSLELARQVLAWRGVRGAHATAGRCHM
jgi:hypothetical protein